MNIYIYTEYIYIHNIYIYTHGIILTNILDHHKPWLGKPKKTLGLLGRRCRQEQPLPKNPATPNDCDGNITTNRLKPLYSHHNQPWYRGWLRNPAPPDGWKPIMGCLPPFSSGFRISQPYHGYSNNSPGSLQQTGHCTLGAAAEALSDGLQRLRHHHENQWLV